MVKTQNSFFLPRDPSIFLRHTNPQHVLHHYIHQSSLRSSSSLLASWSPVYPLSLLRTYPSHLSLSDFEPSLWWTHFWSRPSWSFLIKIWTSSALPPVFLSAPPSPNLPFPFLAASHKSPAPPCLLFLSEFKNSVFHYLIFYLQWKQRKLSGVWWMRG